MAPSKSNLQYVFADDIPTILEKLEKKPKQRSTILHKNSGSKLVPIAALKPYNQHEPNDFSHLYYGATYEGKPFIPGASDPAERKRIVEEALITWLVHNPNFLNMNDHGHLKLEAMSQLTFGDKHDFENPPGLDFDSIKQRANEKRAAADAQLGHNAPVEAVAVPAEDTALRGLVPNLVGGQADQIAAVAGQIGGLNDITSQHSNEIGLLAEIAANDSSKMAWLAESTNSNKDNIAGLTESTQNLVAAVHKNRSDIDTNTAGVAMNKTDIAGLAESTQNLVAAVHKNRSDIDANTAGVADNKKDIATLTDASQANRTDLDKLKQQTEESKQLVEESLRKQKQSESKIEKLEDSLSKALSSNLFSGSGAAKMPPIAGLPEYECVSYTAQAQEPDTDLEDEVLVDEASASFGTATNKAADARTDQVKSPPSKMEDDHGTATTKAADAHTNQVTSPTSETEDDLATTKTSDARTDEMRSSSKTEDDHWAAANKTSEALTVKMRSPPKPEPYNGVGVAVEYGAPLPFPKFPIKHFLPIKNSSIKDDSGSEDEFEDARMDEGSPVQTNHQASEDEGSAAIQQAACRKLSYRGKAPKEVSDWKHFAK